jgi:hypothetical protein
MVYANVKAVSKTDAESIATSDGVRRVCPTYFAGQAQASILLPSDVQPGTPAAAALALCPQTPTSSDDARFVCMALQPSTGVVQESGMAHVVQSLL